MTTTQTRQQPRIKNVKNVQHYNFATKKREEKTQIIYIDPRTEKTRRIYMPRFNTKNANEREQEAIEAIQSLERKNTVEYNVRKKRLKTIPDKEQRRKEAIQARIKAQLKSETYKENAPRKRAGDAELPTATQNVQKTKNKGPGTYASMIKCSIIVKYRNQTPFHFPSQSNNVNTRYRVGIIGEDKMLRAVLGSEYQVFMDWFRRWKSDPLVELYYGWTFTRTQKDRMGDVRVVKRIETLFNGRTMQRIDHLRGNTWAGDEMIDPRTG